MYTHPHICWVICDKCTTRCIIQILIQTTGRGRGGCRDRSEFKNRTEQTHTVSQCGPLKVVHRGVCRLPARRTSKRRQAEPVAVRLALSAPPNDPPRSIAPTSQAASGNTRVATTRCPEAELAAAAAVLGLGPATQKSLALAEAVAAAVARAPGGVERQGLVAPVAE